MKKHLSIIFLLLPLCLNAEEITVTVTDQFDSPIEDAIVWVGPQNTLSAETDSHGEASLQAEINDEYMLVARHQSYGRTTPLYIELISDTNLTIKLPDFTHLRVASFNVEGNRDDGFVVSNQFIPLAKIFWTVQPDIVLVQECPDSSPTFQDFQNTYLPGYNTVISPEMFYIANGICSFLPIKKSYSEGGYDMTRDLFCAEIEIKDWLTLTVMSVHFKAGRDDAAGEKRDQEAGFVVDYCKDLDRAKISYILAGDMNEDIGNRSAPSDIFNILSAAAMEMLEPVDDKGYKSTAEFLWDNKRYYKRYDYLMLQEDLAERAINARVFKTETMTELPAWFEKYDCAKASDHRLIYSDIEVIPEPFLASWITISILFLMCKKR